MHRIDDEKQIGRDGGADGKQSLDSTLSTAMAQSVTTDVSRVDQLSTLNIVERNELISLIRESFGATSTHPNCGLKRDRKAHGKH